MRMLILAVMVSTGQANTIPALQWQGDPVLFEGFSLLPDPNGISMSGGAETQGENDIISYATRSFDVTSPGYFLATTNVMIEVDGLVCDPLDRCGGAGSTVVGANNYLSFSNSQVAPPILDPEVDCNFIPNGTRNCGDVEFPFSDSASNVMFLSVGNYTLYETLEINYYAAYYDGVTASFETDIVPTPEPQGEAILLAIGCAAWGVARRARPHQREGQF